MKAILLSVCLLTLMGACMQKSQSTTTPQSTAKVQAQESRVENNRVQNNRVEDNQVQGSRVNDTRIEPTEFWSAVFNYALGTPGSLGYNHMTETVGPQISRKRCDSLRAEHMELLLADKAHNIRSKCVRADDTGTPL